MAPFFTLVALLTITPVAGMPLKKGRTVLAIPCPTNSLLELCFVPVIPSKATADNKLSILASKAIAIAEGKTFLIKPKFKSIK
ncbi:Uncharacterised protein [uncultured archaeon]|nr:Uncharacterised protein [uncultured archaeon]